jgi:hypothetical protein
MLSRRQEIKELCGKIAAEQDSAKLVPMLKDLRALLAVAEAGDDTPPDEMHGLRLRWSAARRRRPVNSES